MTTVTQLFKMVSANDYEGLNQVIQSGKMANFNTSKSGHSLLSKSIQVRARECFDLLVEIPNYHILQNQSSNINGLSIAVEYYLIGQNFSNEYYFNKLLEKNVIIDEDVVILAIDNNLVFQKLYIRLPKNTVYYNLLDKAIERNNHHILNQLLEDVTNQNLNQIQLQAINKKIFKFAFEHCNIQVLDLIKDKISLTEYLECPTLYCTRNRYNYKFNKELFDYIYNYYKNLSPEVLENIRNIKKFNLRQISCKDHNIYKECLTKILELPIKFDSLGWSIEIIIMERLKSWCILSHHHKELEIVNIVLKSGKVTNNLFNKTFSDCLISLINTKNQNYYYLNVIRKFHMLLDHYGFKPDVRLLECLNKNYTDKEKETFETDKKILIDSLNKINEIKKVIKKTKKKEIEV